MMPLPDCKYQVNLESDSIKPEHILKGSHLAKYTNNKIDLLHHQFISSRNIFPKNLIKEQLMSFHKIYDFTDNFILNL